MLLFLMKSVRDLLAHRLQKALASTVELLRPVSAPI
jgi:hypothetical protein